MAILDGRICRELTFEKLYLTCGLRRHFGSVCVCQVDLLKGQITASFDMQNCCRVDLSEISAGRHGMALQKNSQKSSQKSAHS